MYPANCSRESHHLCVFFLAPFIHRNKLQSSSFCFSFFSTLPINEHACKCVPAVAKKKNHGRSVVQNQTTREFHAELGTHRKHFIVSCLVASFVFIARAFRDLFISPAFCMHANEFRYCFVTVVFAFFPSCSKLCFLFASNFYCSRVQRAKCRA